MSNQIHNNEFAHQGNVPVTQVITHDVRLVEEKIHQREEQHIQPIVERDIEQRVVKQIIQPVHETQVLPTQHATGVLAGEDILINNDRAVAPQFIPEASRIVGATDVNVVQHAPIIEERFHKQVIEEVQPVLYRDVIQNKETILTQPIHERIIDAPIVTQVTRGMMEMNTHSGIPVEPVLIAQPVIAAPREIVREVPVEVVREVIVDRPVEVIREVHVAAPVVAPAQAAFAVIPDGVPVVHDGKIVNAGFGGHDAGQVIRPIETGLQTHGAGIGTGAHNHGNNHSTAHGAHGAHGPILTKHANETHAEKQARKQQQKELKKQESADARAARKLAKEQKRSSKRPHESAAERKARKAEKKRLAAAHHTH